MAADSAGRGDGRLENLQDLLVSRTDAPLGYPGALIARHSDIPSLAQLQANREGTLFGPGLIILCE